MVYFMKQEVTSSTLKDVKDFLNTSNLQCSSKVKDTLLLGVERLHAKTLSAVKEREYWIANHGNNDVVRFIAGVLYNNGCQNKEGIRNFFKGRSFWFSIMLKCAFNRGSIGINGDESAWIDVDGVYYNIDGVIGLAPDEGVEKPISVTTDDINEARLLSMQWQVQGKVSIDVGRILGLGLIELEDVAPCAIYNETEFVELEQSLGGNKEVLQFILLFLHNVKNTVVDLFSKGYCYYFAEILKYNFKRGELYLAYPYEHIVWRDVDGVPYDVSGVCSIYIKLINVKRLNKAIENYKHISL